MRAPRDRYHHGDLRAALIAIGLTTTLSLHITMTNFHLKQVHCAPMTTRTPPEEHGTGMKSIPERRFRSRSLLRSTLNLVSCNVVAEPHYGVRRGAAATRRGR